MSVHQTREYFLTKFGKITDNEHVGEELREVYWKPGNSESFMDLVRKLTGKPLAADAWVHVCTALILLLPRHHMASRNLFRCFKRTSNK